MLNAISRVASWLAFVASILSLLSLIKLGFDINLTAPFKLMLNYYLHFVDYLLGWADPYLRASLNYLSSWIAVDLRLYPHWKHFFVPMWLYFSADAKAVLGYQRKRLALAFLALGGLVALAVSVASGTMPLDSQSMLPLIFTAVGFVVYQSGSSVLAANFPLPYTIRPGTKYTRRQIVSYYLIAFPLGDALIACILIIAGLQARHFDFPSLNISFLILFVIAMALRDIAVSAWIAAFDRAMGQRWIDRFRGLGSQHHGFLVLASVGGAALFIALNAGLELAGQ